MSSSPAPWARRFARLALLAAGLLLAEFGVRAWHACGGGPPGGPAAAVRRAAAQSAGHTPAALVEEDVAEEREQQVLHPFFGWSGSRLDERIARYAASFKEDDDARLDVVITGGSVAVNFVRNFSEDLIEQVLADPRFEGREVRILNLSSGGLKQPQHLIRLAVALNAGWRPDAVINIDGFNELVFPVQNVTGDIEPFYPSFFLWGPLLGELTGGPEYRQGVYEVMREQARAAELVSRFERFGLAHSALASELVWWRLRSIRSDYDAAQERFVSALATRKVPLPDARGFGPEDDELLEACAAVWAESSRSMHALCAARSIAYVHALQPNMHDAGSKPLTPEELGVEPVPSEWVHAVREGYPRLRAAGAALSAAGLTFVDGSHVFAEVRDTLYWDSCHFSAAGNRLLGAPVVRALLASLP